MNSDTRANMILGPEAIKQGFRLHSFDTLASTNDEAMRAAREGDPGNLWVVARSQTGGRGRNGRIWASPSGNLHASLLLIEPSLPKHAPDLGFVAGVALCQTLRDVLGGDERLRIKWPNDALFDGAKLSGILLEASHMPDGRFVCVIGIGVNCAYHPDDLAYPATHLAEIGTLLASPDDVLARLSDAMAHGLALWQGGLGFQSIRQLWLSFAAGLGKPIRVALSATTVDGLFSTIDATGRLVVETNNGPVTIDAGDVFLGDGTRRAFKA